MQVPGVDTHVLLRFSSDPFPLPPKLTATTQGRVHPIPQGELRLDDPTWPLELSLRTADQPLGEAIRVDLDESDDLIHIPCALQLELSLVDPQGMSQSGYAYFSNDYEASRASGTREKTIVELDHGPNAVRIAVSRWDGFLTGYAPGFAPQRLYLRDLPGFPWAVQSQLTIPLQPGAEFRITVADQEGARVTGARVLVASMNARGAGEFVMESPVDTRIFGGIREIVATDRDGAAVIQGIGTGVERLLVKVLGSKQVSPDPRRPFAYQGQAGCAVVVETP